MGVEKCTKKGEEWLKPLHLSEHVSDLIPRPIVI